MSDMLQPIPKDIVILVIPDVPMRDANNNKHIHTA